MFLEIPEEVYEKMRPALFEMGVDSMVSDCTLPSEQVRHIHMEFEELSNQDAVAVANLADKCFAEVAEESKDSFSLQNRRG